MTTPADISLDQLRSIMRAHGVNRIYAKELAPNDNAKNQLYFRGSLEALTLLPIGEIRSDISPKGRPIPKAALNYWWILGDGSLQRAPNAQLILYPQYPEVRLSGMLRGAPNSPSELLSQRMVGRVLLLGITPDGRILSWACSGESKIGRQYQSLGVLERIGVFTKVPLTAEVQLELPKARLQRSLASIHRKDWINSCGLRADGSRVPCLGTKCVGDTLEAELGIPRNSDSKPDFDGWEVKAGLVDNYAKLATSKAVTLMTPEPNGGFYVTEGVKAFVRRFGYVDRLGREDRMNFGGVFRVGARHPLTGLTMQLDGFDLASGKIVDPDGSLQLTDDGGVVAASWSFAKLMKHWNGKHAQAVYVPAEGRIEPNRAYRYGPKVRMGEGTDFLLLVRALGSGAAYYDPAIKLEKESTAAPEPKKRSQFRIKSSDLAVLYHRLDVVDLLEEV